jgi:hypothetical protein
MLLAWRRSRGWRGADPKHQDQQSGHRHQVFARERWTVKRRFPLPPKSREVEIWEKTSTSLFTRDQACFAPQGRSSSVGRSLELTLACVITSRHFFAAEGERAGVGSTPRSGVPNLTHTALAL